MIKRIQRRDFYKFVGEKVVPIGMTFKYKQVTESNIVNCQSMIDGDIQISEDDIVLKKFSVNFAFGDKNPFDQVKFYSKKQYHQSTNGTSQGNQMKS